jgi:hypothetical protein
VFTATGRGPGVTRRRRDKQAGSFLCIKTNGFNKAEYMGGLSSTTGLRAEPRRYTKKREINNGNTTNTLISHRQQKLRRLYQEEDTVIIIVITITTTTTAATINNKQSNLFGNP